MLSLVFRPNLMIGTSIIVISNYSKINIWENYLRKISAKQEAKGLEKLGSLSLKCKLCNFLFNLKCLTQNKNMAKRLTWIIRL